MRDNNVLRVQFGCAAVEHVSNPLYREPKQLELFDLNYGATRAIAYLDIAVLDQDRLIRSLTMKSVKTIIDLRGVPVFPKPRFDHRYLMTYFYERSVDYIECAMIARAPIERSSRDDSLTRWFSGQYADGITACIIDDAAVSGGAVAAFRNRMTRTSDAFVEIHPRALI